MQILPTVSQGVPATKAFFPVNGASKVQKPQVENGSDEPMSVPAPTGGGAQALPTEIDLQAFFAAWGTDNEQFDVTKDGTVDAKDLAVFLGAVTEEKSATPQEVIDSWGQPYGAGDLNGDGKVDAVDLAMALGNAEAPAAPPSQSVADGVQKAWGTDNAQYDLNGDGTVNAVDLAIALGGQQEAATPTISANGDQGLSSAANANEVEPQDGTTQAAQAATQFTDAVFGTKDGDGDGSLTADELADGLAYVRAADTNADSAVSRDELQARLTAEFGKAASAGISMETVASKWADALLRSDTTAIRAKSAYSDGSGPLVNQLYGRLASSGFGRTPPSNINRLVQGLTQGLGMNDSQRASLMRGLANRYPQGLGLSAKA